MNGNENVGVHFLDLKHVVEVGTVVVLAGVARAALDNGFFGILVLFFREYEYFLSLVF
jgi:hypothetical protein